MNRLSEFDFVTVNVPFEAREARTLDVFDAQVVAIVGATAALEFVDLADQARLPAVVRGSLVTYPTDSGLMALKGTLVHRRDTGDVRFTVADGIGLNRRSATRIKADYRMRIGHMNSTEVVTGRSVDVSADGVLATTPLRANVGDDLHVSIDVDPDAPPVKAVARVVRVTPGELAMQFDLDERTARAQLGRIVVDHNREFLRRRREALQLVEF
ncbi:PilZ domain-containing protein [Solirubrobacter phytolaccae]|uniref:PilZ domain-containing protein n=1 Tax=Solirubrobacter phytolaccae TaxID=1404360 RepID=A0A9X3S801_9ACTN|nr:PilZ domain-containing protein [Solirubrobacter phytolaccae]MDA0181609.1 PilZ domain-containing protein [Solirubrobacter phytolaccae]